VSIQVLAPDGSQCLANQRVLLCDQVGRYLAEQTGVAPDAEIIISATVPAITRSRVNEVVSLLKKDGFQKVKVIIGGFITEPPAPPP
jgi:hypothetical protein